MLDEAELRTLLRERESERVERKASDSDRNDLRRTICALANDLAGTGRPGVLFIGVRDDGSCADLRITDRLLRDLGDLRSDGKIHPFPTMHIRALTLDGCQMAVVIVEPSDNPPVKFEGRAYVRVGPTIRVATAEEERRLTERRRWWNLPFDQQPVPGATLDDLDLVRFKLELLPALVPPDVLAANERSEMDQLRALRMLHPNGTPSVLAVLAVGKEPRRFFPGAYVQFVKFAGTRLSDPIVASHEITGTLLDQFRQLDQLLRLNISVRTSLGPGPAVERPDYPLVALQELARNALIHRNYELSTTPVRVNWYTDRVEIVSPGGPYGEVTVERFGELNVTSYRNPGLAELASRLGYAQRFGTGIARARAELEKNGNPPLELRAETNQVLAIVRCHP
jgi:ATP-dependent DNA helicase RecG